MLYAIYRHRAIDCLPEFCALSIPTHAPAYPRCLLPVSDGVRNTSIITETPGLDFVDPLPVLATMTG